MKKPFTIYLQLMLLALALGTGFTSWGQIIPQPVAVTGFNADIVANGTGNATAGSSSNSSVDANSYVFLSKDYTTTTAPGFFHPNVGLPYGQTFLGAATPNVLYKLQPYAASNSLRLYGMGGATPAATATGTLTFTNPAKAGTLYILATSGSGADATTALVNFTDGTSQSFSISVQDWFNNTGYAYAVNNRLLVTGTNFDAIIANTATPNPRLYQYPLVLAAANQNKNIAGVTFTKSATVGAYVQIMAISSTPPTNSYTPMALTFPAGGAPAVYVSNAFATPSASGQDVITNGTSGNVITNGTATTPYTNTSATADTDGAGYFLTATDYNSSTAAHNAYGLPVNGVNSVTTPTGLLTSIATTGLTYQLADYSGINALQIRGVGSGSVSFAATAATEVYVLTTSTNSTTSTGTMTVNFTDGTSHAYAVNFNNWFSTPTSATSGTSNATTSIGAYGRGRLQPGTTGTGGSVSVSTTTPYLFENKMVLSASEYSKTISSVTVANTSSANAVAVLGVTLNANTALLAQAQCAFPSGHSAAASVATACAGTSFNLVPNGLPAVNGFTYQWQYSTDNSSWNNLTTSTSASPYSTNPTSLSCTVLNQTVATYYRCLVQCAFDQAGTNSPSASVQVGQTDPVNCYPYPATSTSGCTLYGSISAVQIAESATPANIVLNKTGLSCTTTTEPYATYGIYRDAGANGTLDKSKDYTLTVTVTNASRLGVWLDLNQDGVYNATINSTALPSGEYFGTATVTAAGNLTLAIPAAALATVTNGVVGMRVRTERNTATIIGNTTATTTIAGNSNATTAYGVTLDYAIIVTGATPCAGTPTATAPTSATSTACPGSTFSLTATGPALGTTGLTYQWEYKLSSASAFASVPATLTDVNGSTVTTNATTAILTIANQRAATDYRVTITCVNGGASAISPATTIAQSQLANCYCQNSNNATNEYITNVTLSTINNTSGSSQSNTPTGFISYTTNPTSTQTTTLNRNATYPISVTATSASTTPTEMVWIDYDQSGTFEASEYTLIGTQSAIGTVTGTTTLAIPATALLGDTRMRVRMHNDASGTSASACANAWNGETEDYRITIGPELLCTGTPPTLTAAASAGAVCASTSFTLTATGAASSVTGISYQWQSSPAGAGTFTNLGTAQTTTTYTVASQTAATDYQLVSTCTNSSLSATSNVVSVTQNSFLNCYCLPTYTNTSSSSDGIARVVLGTLNNATGYNAPYTSYTSAQTGSTPTLQIPDLVPGATASVDVTFGSDPNQWGAVWMDFNQNGIFGDVANEYVAATAQTGASGTYTFTLPVPLTATAGQTRMRVRGGEDSASPSQGQACGASSSAYGEGEDYLVNILASVACTGTPPTATATASVATACVNAPFILTATGITPGISGLTYQWQSSPAGQNNFVDLGAVQTTTTYTVTGQTEATDYQVLMTCTNSNLKSRSNVVAVGQNNFLTCYTTPIVSTGANEYIRSVSVTIDNGFTNLTNANSTSGFGDFTTNAALTTTLSMGGRYPMTIVVQANNAGSQGGLWVDYDHSATFDAGEYFAFGGTPLGGSQQLTYTFRLPIPTTAATLLGATRMRVRWRNGTILPTDGQTAGPTNWYGETEDYLVTIDNSPLPVKLLSFIAEAEGNAVRLAWATASEQNSSHFEVERSADGQHFTYLDRVNARGNATSLSSYTFRDIKSFEGSTRYYRLRQVDLDGSTTYSPIRTVQLGTGTTLVLAPNPAHSTVTVSGTAAGAPVEVFDAVGRLIIATTADAAGTARLALPAKLASGIYVVRSGRQVSRLAVE